MNLASRCRLALILALCAICACCGCSSSEPANSSGDSATATSARQINLKVAVIDDVTLGPVIQRQFAARRNGEIQLTELSWEDFAGNDFAAAQDHDVVVYPMWRIGELASRELLSPIMADNMPRDEADRRSILRADRENAIAWGGQPVAVSLGQAHWVMLCRSDVLDEHGLAIPDTWKDFSKLTETLAGKSEAEALPTRVVVPLQGHWASHALSLRAASAIRLPGRYSSYFDVSDMTPLIDSAPFLRSLQGWEKDLTSATEPQSPQQVLADYAEGKIAVAIVPLNARWLDEVAVATLPPTTVAAVPSWSAVFDLTRQGWMERGRADSPIVPLVGFSGMLASTTANSSQLRNSMDFLEWVSEKQISTIVSVESPNAGVSRKSHLGNPAKWLAPQFGDEQARQFADILGDANDSRLRLNALRIPQADQYLSMLDDAVRNVLLKDANAVEQLASAASAWSQRVAESGAEETKSAYRKSEGLSR